LLVGASVWALSLSACVGASLLQRSVSGHVCRLLRKRYCSAGLLGTALVAAALLFFVYAAAMAGDETLFGC
jgi:hypothetical protein